jgi:two-component system cell cycle response regulator
MSEKEKGLKAGKAPKGEVKNLTDRRMQQMADENHELKQYVADVMKRLRDNERLFSRLFELESKVLSATDAEDLCFTLLRGLRSGFSLDMVRFWFDRSSFMGNCQLDGLSERDLVWIEKGEIANMGLVGRHVCLMRLDKEKGFVWLEKQDDHLASLALLVLGNPEKPFGILGMGSVEADRFSPDQSVDFLQHLAQVIGLSLENAIARERLARISITDSLTGSHNRRFLQPHSHQPLSQWFGKDTQVACLYFDVDGFKAINDRLGQAAGDDLLTSVASTSQLFVRAKDPLIRMGGDEFVLLLPGCSESKACEIAGRIIAACGEVSIQDEKVAISMGVAYSAIEQDLAVKKLIENADQAMYVAKALGGSRFEVSEENKSPSK